MPRGIVIKERGPDFRFDIRLYYRLWCTPIPEAEKDDNDRELDMMHEHQLRATLSWPCIKPTLYVNDFPNNDGKPYSRKQFWLSLGPLYIQKTIMFRSRSQVMAYEAQRRFNNDRAGID